jgi:hypothetical protein
MKWCRSTGSRLPSEVKSWRRSHATSGKRASKAPPLARANAVADSSQPECSASVQRSPTGKIVVITYSLSLGRYLVPADRALG